MKGFGSRLIIPYVGRLAKRKLIYKFHNKTSHILYEQSQTFWERVRIDQLSEIENS